MPKIVPFQKKPATRKKDNFKNAIRLMRQNGAKIADTEIVLFELLKTSRN